MTPATLNESLKDAESMSLLISANKINYSFIFGTIRSMKARKSTRSWVTKIWSKFYMNSLGSVDKKGSRGKTSLLMLGHYGQLAKWDPPTSARLWWSSTIVNDAYLIITRDIYITVKIGFPSLICRSKFDYTLLTVSSMVYYLWLIIYRFWFFIIEYA